MGVDEGRHSCVGPEALMSRLRTAAESAGATAQTNMIWWIEIVQSPWITLQIKKYNITSVASSSVNFDDLSAGKWETGWEEEEGEEMKVKTLQMKRVGLEKKKLKRDKSKFLRWKNREGRQRRARYLDNPSWGKYSSQWWQRRTLVTKKNLRGTQVFYSLYLQIDTTKICTWDFFLNRWLTLPGTQMRKGS